MKDPLVRSIMCMQTVEEVIWNTGGEESSGRVFDFLDA